MASLFEEFEIHPIGTPLFHIAGHSIAFTNSALFMFLAIIGGALLMIVATRAQSVVPGRWQMFAESLYNMSADMVIGTAGEKARPFFPFVFSLFIFILLCNMLSMLPWSLAVTSHVVVNFALALVLFTIIIITGFVKHGTHFFHLFVPQGAPKFMLPFLIILEFFSFAVRPFSLSVRLFANLLAGHVLMAVFAGMSASLLTAGWLAGFSILPLIGNIAITGFEFLIMFLQAYVYAMLASVYLRDATEMH